MRATRIISAAALAVLVIGCTSEVEPQLNLADSARPRYEAVVDYPIADRGREFAPPYDCTPRFHDVIDPNGSEATRVDCERCARVPADEHADPVCDLAVDVDCCQVYGCRQCCTAYGPGVASCRCAPWVVPLPERYDFADKCSYWN